MDLTLSYSDAAQSHIETVTMTLDADRVGPSGHNSAWRGVIPGSAIHAGQRLQFWVRAADRNGHVFWDSRAGANYQLDPRSFPVVWAGGFGRLLAGTYQEGAPFA